MPYHVLFVCSTNSARSIMAESLLNALGGGRFRGFSAGSHPSGRVHPFAIDTLVRNGYPVAGVRSKSWNEFTGKRAPRIDLVIMVCDAVSGDSCPVFPGRQVTAHWEVLDPATVIGNDENRRIAFQDVLVTLRRRVQALTSLPFESVDKIALRGELAQIGRS